MPDEKTIQQKMEDLREWLETKPQIPEIEELMLHRFLHSCYYELPATKKCIELFHNIRAGCPRVFANRDPDSAEIVKLFTYTYNVFLTNGKQNVRIWQLNDPGMYNYDHCQTTKGFMMMTDVSFTDDTTMPEEDVVILDCRDLSLKFVTKCNLGIIRTSAQYLQEGLPVRLKQIHVVNSPAYTDKLYALVKPFLNQNVIDLVHFHKPGSETLFEHLGRDVIPSDYGGSAPSMETLMAEWVKKINNKREFFLDDTAWRSIDVKAKNGHSTVDTSFKSLAID